MSDLISRKAAIDSVHHVLYEFFDITEDDEESPMTYNDIRLLELNKAITSQLKKLPSVETVVRCKDCENWMDDWEDAWSDGRHYCAMVDKSTEGSWFCADGEKKNEKDELLL